MKIFRCSKITENVLQAFQNLIPQLCPDCKLPTKFDLEQIIHSPNSILFLAEENEIIASLTLVIFQTTSGKKASIEDVVVDKNFREQGVGKKLLEHAIHFSRQMEISKIDLSSRPERIAANQLYQKLGFVQRETNVYRLIL